MSIDENTLRKRNENEHEKNLTIPKKQLPGSIGKAILFVADIIIFLVFAAMAVGDFLKLNSGLSILFPDFIALSGGFVCFLQTITKDKVVIKWDKILYSLSVVILALVISAIMYWCGISSILANVISFIVLLISIVLFVAEKNK